MKNEITVFFAEQMKRKRRELGLTQRALAEKLNYSEKAISKWESATALPPSNVLLPLSRALGCGIDDLFSASLSKAYHLGIDGGGTKTDFTLIDSDGELIKRVKLGATNPVDIGIEKTLECLGAGISRVCAGIPYSRISVHAGLAGGSTPEYKLAVGEYLSGFGFSRYSCGSDADSIIEAGLYIDGAPRDGVVVIMGTGSVAFSRCAGVKTRHGGYGYLLGDAGCGFSIGRDGIIAALLDEEGTGEYTAITEILVRMTGNESVLDGLGSYYKSPKRTLASYSPAVFEAEAQGDAVAKRIIDENMKYIAELIMGAAACFGGERIPVVLAGGLTDRAEHLLPIIKAHLKNPESFELLIFGKAPIKGALLLAGAEKIQEFDENA